MGKKYFVIYFALVIINFYMFFGVDIKAAYPVITQKPTASDIIYSQPLYMSVIDGGESNVKGSYKWKNELEIYKAGTHNAIVVFTPDDQMYDSVEFELPVNVHAKKVYLKFERSLQKRYDQNNKLDVPGYIVQGIIDDDVYVSGNITATLESVLIGENIKVTIEGLELRGENKNNYYLDLDNHTASIHPVYLEKFGGERDRVEFLDNIYVPVNSVFLVDKINDLKFYNDEYNVKAAYMGKVMNNGRVIDIKDKVAVKLKIDRELMNIKRIKIFNLYNGDYKEIKEYTYKDGYLVYFCNGLGTTVIVQKKPNYTWIYVVSSILLAISSCLVIKQVLANRVKINRYKSLKRRKDNGDFEF